MKDFKKIQLYLTAFLMIILVSCSKKGEYSLTETPPLDFRSYYNGLTVTFACATKEATNVSWNFGDGSAAVTGDSVIYTYAETGNYVITLNGTVEGKDYTFHTVLRVDKPSVIDLEDGTFDDWNGVTYPDFIIGGQDKVIGGKVDYDANYIYIFIEWSTTSTGGLATADGAIMDLYMDVDNTITTGFSSAIGAEILFEGNIPSEWFDYLRFTGAAQGDWSWTPPLTIENGIVLGYSETVGETVRMEFALSREAFGINKDAFAFRLDLSYSDWSASVGSLAIGNETRIEMMMDKQ
jgi:hypothetical protein